MASAATPTEEILQLASLDGGYRHVLASHMIMVTQVYLLQFTKAVIIAQSITKSCSCSIRNGGTDKPTGLRDTCRNARIKD